MALERRRSASRKAHKMTPDLIKRIESKLQDGWSPDQISGRFKREGIAFISHETIYRHIWQDKSNGGSFS